MEFGRVSSLQGIDFSLPEDDPNFCERNSLISSSPSERILIGCPIWSQKAWTGDVFPQGTQPKDYLRYYGEFFSTVEVNSSFYHLPSAEQVEKWCEQVPEHFRFCPKIPRRISHDHQLQNVEEEVEKTILTFKGFGDRYGSAFLQLPPAFEIHQLQSLKRFLELWPKELKLSVEFRHTSWFQQGHLQAKVYDLLQQHQAAAAVSDVSGRRDVVHTSLPTDFLLVRFLGNQMHPTDNERLEQWAYRICDWLKRGLGQVYFLVHQPNNQDAPKTVYEFLHLLNWVGDLGLTIPERKTTTQLSLLR